MGLIDRFQNAWNVFANKDPTERLMYDMSTGPSYSYRPDITPTLFQGDKSIINSIYTRIAVDAASISIRHVILDDNQRYKSTVDDRLNDCFDLEANIDQTGRSFIQDVVYSMLSNGHAALVPIFTDVDPLKNPTFKVEQLRVGTVVEWRPNYVKVNVFDQQICERKDLILPKRVVAIVQNPFYTVMNERNSIAQRLIRKLNLLDVVDEQSGSGKLDLIIQLPYAIKTEARKNQAEKRRREIERQLAGSKYGIAYTDGTEKITQLNRSLENNLLKTVEYLTDMLFSQLSMSKAVFDGTASEPEMINYHIKTIEPIVSAIANEVRRKFLSPTARTQGHSIYFFMDPFRLTPTTQLANLIDVLSRNEIITSNEGRQILGMKPSDDPNADKLRNANMPHPENESDQKTVPNTNEET